MNCLNKITARTSLLRVLEHIVYPSTNNSNKNDNKEWQKQAPSEHYFFFAFPFSWGQTLKHFLVIVWTYLIHSTINKINEKSTEKKKTPQYDILLAPAAAWAPSGFIDEAINRSADQPIERAKNVACQIFKYKYNNNSWTTNNNNNNSIGEKQW